MKCIQCNTDNNWRDRRENEGRCKNCGHPFVFDLQKGSPFTDLFFENALNAISAENTLYFTPQQLYYLIKRRSKSISLLGLLGDYIKYLCTTIFMLFLTAGYFLKYLKYSQVETIVMLVAMLYNICFMVFCWLRSDYSKINYQSRRANAKMLQVLGAIVILIAAIGRNGVPVILLPVIAFLGLSSIYLGYRQLNRQGSIGQDLEMGTTQIIDWLKRWQQVNINPIKILPEPSQDIPATVNTDISAYSFDRVMVCDRAAIAQMLIANNFHFENNCAVLSITGYPQNIFNTVMQMLRLNPNLKVYALHDASPDGVSLLHRLGSSPNWFANSSVAMYDLGLLPRHVLKSKNMFVRRSHEFAPTARQLPEPVRQSLSKDEIEWLEMGNYVELEFFSPRRLLQIVTQGIARSRELGSANDMTSVYGDDDNTSTSAMIFASESFG